MKKNIYGWIILILFLIPSCIFTAIGINSFLKFMAGTPLYTNMYRYGDIDMTIKLPQGWQFKNDQDGFYLTDTTGTETLIVTEVKSATSMEVAKQMFKISFESTYKGDLDYKESEISGNTTLYTMSYTQYTDKFVTGVISNNDLYVNFVYTNRSGAGSSPIMDILASVKLSEVTKVDEDIVESPQATSKNENKEVQEE